MQLDIVNDWKSIKKYAERAMKASIYVSVSSVNKAGEPTVMPIGSLVLNDNQTGFFLEKFPQKIGENAVANPNFCILAENTSKWLIVKSLFGGKLDYFGVKLYGRFGEKRPATNEEIERIKAKIPFAKFKRFNDLLFGGKCFVRELNFTRAEAIVADFDRETKSVKIR